MNRFSSLQLINIAAYIVTLLVNFFSQTASALGIGLFPNTVAALGESRAIFFLPAGYVFAIWGVIYLGLGAYIVYQGRPAQRNNPIIGKIGYWFLLSSIGNVAWLVLFLNEQTAASTIAMLAILVSLIVIFLRLEIGRAAVERVVFWAVHIPFTIYLGWITVATVANITAVLYDADNITGFLGIGADVWAVIMMVIASALALLMLARHGAVAYALVVVWSLVGIYARPFDTPLFSRLAGLDAGLVNTAALALAVIVAVAVGVILFLNWQRQTASGRR